MKPDLSLDDANWTAYALGELEDETVRAKIEESMSSDEAREHVEEIRRTATLLRKGLANEPAPALTAEQRSRIESRTASGGTKWVWWIGSSAAAAAILLLWLRLELPFYLLPAPPVASMRSEALPRPTPPAALAAPDTRSPSRLPSAQKEEFTDASRSLGYISGDDYIVLPRGGGGGSGGIGGGVAALRDDVRRFSYRDRPFNTESYDRIEDNPFLDAARSPLSTFAIDVDTASYANVRRYLESGSLPPKDAVRIEEMINYFDYDYPDPPPDRPFSVSVEVASAPWKPEHRLVRIGLKGRPMDRDRRPPLNLVFLLDVSGSMRPYNKLPLLKEAMRLLVDNLRENDHVAIVVYAGASGLVLPPTSGGDKPEILDALDRLQAGGSTNGGEGLALAYDTAAAEFVRGGINRVVLATDGDFNVGVTNQGDLTRLIEERAKTGVFLSVLGFGMGNLKDSTLEKLADRGNGNYAYIDSLAEARKVLVQEMGATLVTIAKDVKIQVELNPAEVGSYRLIGYENRMLRAEDFNDDRKDAGEIGAGHTVTALYEIVPPGTGDEGRQVDPLKYQRPPVAAEASRSGELMTLKLRYKDPDGDTSRLIEVPVRDEGKGYAEASRDYKFAAAVASFGMILRDSPYKGNATPDAVIELAHDGTGNDPQGYRSSMAVLVRRAKYLLQH
jgi:Ca-activated chloride channel homolog